MVREPAALSRKSALGGRTARRPDRRPVNTTPEYIGLLGTYSHHRLLPTKQRKQLHGAIAEALDRFGGEIEIFYEANLYLAQRL